MDKFRFRVSFEGNYDPEMLDIYADGIESACAEIETHIAALKKDGFPVVGYSAMVTADHAAKRNAHLAAVALATKSPSLRQVDLLRGKERRHPDIVVGREYLAKWAGHYMAGTFSEAWCGLNFYPHWAGTPIQFNTPGSNLSEWEGLWELVENERK